MSVMALRELPYGRFRIPRYPDLTYENAMDRIDEPWVRDYKRRGFPIRDMLTGRVNIVRFHQSSQLEIIINQIYVFFEHERENWTREKDQYDTMEQNFAKNLFNVLVCVKRNLDWSPGGKSPIDRGTYEVLVRCYEFEPFRKYWSQRKKMTAVGYKNTITFYYDTFNQEGQAEMRHQTDRNDELIYTERLN